MTADPLVPALEGASLHSLLMCVSKALTRSGFGDVEIQDRRSSRQKSRHGGHELTCLSSVGGYPLKVVVKVVRDDVRTRMVDELAGTVLRTQADLGLLVTPFNVSPKARAAQARYRPVRLELVDGKRLADFMRCSGIGVRPKGSVDYAFFAELEAVSGRMLAFLREERP
ncbi:MAG: restriction endonuclease [Fimbriimonas sp.]